MNCELRKRILLDHNPDVISLNETRLKGNKTIDLKVYTWYGHHRAMHKRAVKGSGGVDPLVKNKLFESYEIKVKDKSVEGILALQFKNRFTGYSFVIFTCYLPSEGSTRSTGSHSFFGHLTVQMFNLSDVDAIYRCGDFNSRIGNLDDGISEVDGIPNRKNLNSTVDSYGEILIEFLRDVKCCVLNGRISLGMIISLQFQLREKL